MGGWKKMSKTRLRRVVHFLITSYTLLTGAPSIGEEERSRNLWGERGDRGGDKRKVKGAVRDI